MPVFMNKTIRQAKRLITAVVGLTVLATGVALIVLPGPAFIVIPIGLGILATEFVWAKNLLKKINSKIQKKRAETNTHQTSQ